MARFGEPCPDCGRAQTEMGSYPEARSYYCWWCEERAADDVGFRLDAEARGDSA